MQPCGAKRIAEISALCAWAKVRDTHIFLSPVTSFHSIIKPDIVPTIFSLGTCAAPPGSQLLQRKEIIRDHTNKSTARSFAKPPVMASLRRNRTMPTDGAIAKFLYTILKQLDLKSVGPNEPQLHHWGPMLTSRTDRLARSRQWSGHH
jgi:hypothetical protein